MGTQTLETRKPKQTILERWLMEIEQVLAGALVPRSSAGVPVANAGSLGLPSYRWKRAFVIVGEYGPGDILKVYDYAGTISVMPGWMLCNGRLINEANYDTEHAAGAWAKYVGSSPLNGRYLPNLAGKYLTGKVGPTQSGLVPITYNGNAGNAVNMDHTHTLSLSSDGSGMNPEFPYGSVNMDHPQHSHGNSASGGTSPSLSAVNIQPKSLEVKFYMRVSP